MHIRIVTGQPWDAPADVLVVPVVGDPDFAGPLGELDRRSGGELSGLHAFGELRGKRFSTSLGAGGELPAKRVVSVLGGPGRRAGPRGRPQGGRNRDPAPHRPACEHDGRVAGPACGQSTVASRPRPSS